MTTSNRMRNITGSPAEGSDFFDRPKDIRRLRRELDNGAHIVLTAPRRVGKTSLVLKACSDCRQDSWAAAYLNVEGCADELAFAEKLVDELKAADLKAEALTQAGLLFQGARRAIGGIKVGIGFDLEIAAPNAEASTLGRTLESIFREVAKHDKRVLIAVDELPELLLKLSKQDRGHGRVEHFLHWLRALRQTHRGRIHWVFLGSIGLENFVEERNLRKTINDLTPMGLEALTPEEAHNFLHRLGQDNGLIIDSEAASLILEQVGWPLPHHLQIVFHALVDLEVEAANAAAIQNAVEYLLRPDHRSQFDTWYQRLDEQLQAPDAVAAKAILRQLCRHSAGRTRENLLQDLMSQRQQASEAEISAQLARLLQLLQRDGYLLEQSGTYTFRSFLLRQYWYRREVL